MNIRSLNEYMCICWCVNLKNYRMHGEMVKIEHKLYHNRYIKITLISIKMGKEIV